jgi:orotidine-5'-phosphate decarboxylase
MSINSTHPIDPRDRLIVALDTPSLGDAEKMADRLQDAVRWFKIGSPLFTAAGPQAITALLPRGRIFLDLKFHDIPSTVAGGVEAAARHGVSLCTVHAAGGVAMMRAALEAAERGAAAAGHVPPRLLAVTLLTSVDAAVLADLGIPGIPHEAAVRLARLAKTAGLSGAVTSPLEVGAIRAACGPGFLLVCPGIRSEGEPAGDQRRTHTPRQAIAAGADMLVVGRPVTRAADPRAAAQAILRQIGGA